MCLYSPDVHVQNHLPLVHFVGVGPHPLNLQRLEAEKGLESLVTSSEESTPAGNQLFVKISQTHDVSKVDLRKAEGFQRLAGLPDGRLDGFPQELLHVHPKEGPGLLQHLGGATRAEDASDTSSILSNILKTLFQPMWITWLFLNRNFKKKET